jgi:hypothetical protein
MLRKTNTPAALFVTLAVALTVLFAVGARSGVEAPAAAAEVPTASDVLAEIAPEDVRTILATAGAHNDALQHAKTLELQLQNTILRMKIKYGVSEASSIKIEETPDGPERLFFVAPPKQSP